MHYLLRSKTSVGDFLAAARRTEQHLKTNKSVSLILSFSYEVYNTNGTKEPENENKSVVDQDHFYKESYKNVVKSKDRYDRPALPTEETNETKCQPGGDFRRASVWIS